MQRDGHVPYRDDRPRQPARGVRLLPLGAEGGRDADHRHRGVRRARVAQAQAEDPVGAAAPEARRRLRFRWLHPQDDLGGQRDRAAQPLQAVVGRLRRGLAPEVAAYGQGDHLAVVRGSDRVHRLPLRRGPDEAAARPVRRGGAGGLRLQGHLRRGALLPGADGPRHRDRAPGPRRAPGDRQEALHPAARDERLALHVRVRGDRARRPAVHPDRQEPLRPGPLPLRRHRLLPQDHRGDVRRRLLRRLAGGVRQHPPGRAADRHRRDVREARPDAEVRDPRGLHGGHLVPGGGPGRDEPPFPRRRPRGPAEAGRVRDGHHHPDGVPGVLPGRRRLHHVGQEQRHRRRPRPRLREQARSSRTRWASPTSTRSSTD